jgi:hypothetical protein
MLGHNQGDVAGEGRADAGTPLAGSHRGVCGHHEPRGSGLVYPGRLSRSIPLKSAVSPQGAYAEQEDDSRFVTNWVAMQSIATSHAQNDSGMFELNFGDERYLPYDGAGAISRWRIELPKDCNAFDFETLSDVVLHVKYTARKGGEILKKAAKIALQHENVMTDIAPCAIIEPPSGGGSSGSGAGERLCEHPPHRQGGEGCNLVYLPLFPGMRA